MRRVFISGCWDRLHPGHLEALRFARSLGDHLTVSVGRDESIRRLKSREPIFNQWERLGMVASLRFVDHALIPAYDGSDDCFPIVEAMRPDIWVVNADDPNIAEKQELATRLGIGLFLNARPAAWHSTTKLAAAMGEIA